MQEKCQLKALLADLLEKHCIVNAKCLFYIIYRSLIFQSPTLDSSRLTLACFWKS